MQTHLNPVRSNLHLSLNKAEIEILPKRKEDEKKEVSRQSASPVNNLASKIATSFEMVGEKPRKTLEEHKTELLSSAHHEEFVYYSDNITPNVILKKNKIWIIAKKIVTIAKIVIGILIFPLGIYWLLQKNNIERLAILPALTKGNEVYKTAEELAREPGGIWRIIRKITVYVEGHRINAYIATDPEILKNGEWVFGAGGNNQAAIFSTLMAVGSLESLQRHIAIRNGSYRNNLLFFDYPGVLGSEGPIGMPMMQKVNVALFKMLQEEFKAKKIIPINTSMGGGVGVGLAQMLEKDPTFLKETKVVVINVSTYSSFINEVKSIAKKILGEGPIGKAITNFASWLIKRWEWDADVAEASTILAKHHIPEIILYCDKDPVIAPDASLAHAVNRQKGPSPEKRAVLFLDKEKHLNTEWKNPHVAPPNYQAMHNIVQLTRCYMGESKEDPVQYINYFNPPTIQIAANP